MYDHSMLYGVCRNSTKKLWHFNYITNKTFYCQDFKIKIHLLNKVKVEVQNKLCLKVAKKAQSKLEKFLTLTVLGNKIK